MSAGVVGFALILLVAIMLAGKYLRVKLKFLQKILLPSSIIAGILALVAGDQVIGRLADVINWDWLADGGLFTEDIYTVWSSLPGLLISVVFATLFLGARIPKPGRVVKLAGPQLSIGIAYGSGQYVVGLLLAVLILAPLFDVDEKFGALIEIAFEGGHGTAAGMQPAFDDVGMPEATDLALAMATVGLVAGIIVGMGFLNWAVRKGKTQVIKNIDQQSESELQGLYTSDEQVSAGKQTARPNSIEPLTLHMAVVGVAIIIGWLLLELITWIENILWGQPDSVLVSEGEGTTLLGHITLFPLAMIGGVIVQLFLDKTGRTELIDHEMMKRIQGLGLDLLIASALATISLSVIADYWQAFVLLSVVGILFNVAILWFFTPRVIPEFWVERGVGDFGQSMGVTATGLALLRVADPDEKSPALEAFGYKQLAFEPFFGGGLITALCIPVMFAVGNVYVILIPMAIVFIIALVAGMVYKKGVDKGKWNDPAVEELQGENA